MDESEQIVQRSDAPLVSDNTEHRFGRYFPLVLGASGIVSVVTATTVSSANAQAAASQDWPPFVLVAGLLLIGLVADGDQLFAAAGNQLAKIRSGVILFLGITVMIGIVTAVLNLDTSVAFLTPVLVYTARSRHEQELPLLAAGLLLSNAGSLFLTGSNLTNLIVLGQIHLSGAAFLTRMWAPALTALIATAMVIAVTQRKTLRTRTLHAKSLERPTFGVGLAAVVIATAFIITLHNPALPVVTTGIVAAAIRITEHKLHARRVFEVLGFPTLIGLFGIAMALGTLGRSWSGPAVFESHLDIWGTAVFAALSAIVVNNLPAASLLAARVPKHPFALLIGLNLGPNLCITGSLAWLLWLRAAKTAGARPSIAKTSRIGLIAAPISIAATLSVMVLTSPR